MSYPPTPYQLYTARIWGVVFSPSEVTGWELKQKIEQAQRGDECGNERQLLFANSLGIDDSEYLHPWDLVRAIHEAYHVRAFIFSVYRRHREAQWKSYDECGICPKIVNEIGKMILSDDRLSSASQEYRVFFSASGGDSWCRLGSAWRRNAAVHFVIENLRSVASPRLRHREPPKNVQPPVSPPVSPTKDVLASGEVGGPNDPRIEFLSEHFPMLKLEIAAGRHDHPALVDGSQSQRLPVIAVRTKKRKPKVGLWGRILKIFGF